jgi:hypothetical protein
LELNELPSQLEAWLPPTDSRLRPDQVALERGDKEKATSEKNRLEVDQRVRRHRMEANGESWKPLWFEPAHDEATGGMFWRYKGNYWNHRQDRAFNQCPKIFLS